MGFVKALKSLDFYRKIERDLTQGTAAGALISLFGAVLMITLFVLEFNNYLTTQVSTQILVDDFEDSTLQVNFNITVERIPCPFISIGHENVLGTHKANVTKNVRKWRIKTKGKVQRKLDEHHGDGAKEVKVQEKLEPHQQRDSSEPFAVTDSNFEGYLKEHDVVLINFYAPWCIWSKRLMPVWKHLASVATERHGRRVGIAWVDCTNKDQVKVCHKNHIQAFPTVVTFRGGDAHSHNHYDGDRTVDAFMEHIDTEMRTMAHPSPKAPDDPSLHIQEAEMRDYLDGDGEHAPAVEGCQVSGFVLVQKVPGSVILQVISPKHSFQNELVNVSHIIHHLSFGQKFEGYEVSLLPKEVGDAMHKIDNHEYWSKVKNVTHEHYLKVVGTTFKYLNVGTLQTYKYTTHSAVYHSLTAMPQIKFHYDLSPMNVVVTEKYKPFYQFVTNLFAIIGGVFTVFGLMDSFVYNTHNLIKKKLQIGKQN